MWGKNDNFEVKSGPERSLESRERGRGVHKTIGHSVSIRVEKLAGLSAGSLVGLATRIMYE